MNNPSQRVIDYWEKVDERITWQVTELNFFIMLCFRIGSHTLAEAPIKLQSGKYEEAPKREKTQAEMIDEMMLGLANIPRFSAYAKVIQEKERVQEVLKRKIETFPLAEIPQRYLSDPTYQTLRASIEHNMIRARNCHARADIEEDLRRRRERWQRGRPSAPGKPTGGDEPPPTYE